MLGATLDMRPVYGRRGRYYSVGDWQFCASACDDSISVASGLFDIDEAEKNPRVLSALHEAAMSDEEVTIRFHTGCVRPETGIESLQHHGGTKHAHSTSS